MISAEPPKLFADAPELAVKMGDRSLFTGLEPLVYVNHASISPPSILSRKAVQTLMADCAKRGAAAFPTWIAQRSRLREKLAKLVGAKAGDIALTQNTTRGVSDVALCFPWKKGDRVIVFRGEFPSNVTPWQRAAELFELEVVMLDADRFRTEPDAAMSELGVALAKGARLVAVSAVEFQTGFAMPLRLMSEAARSAGAALFVDAVQAVGMVPIDVDALGIDFLASGSHKWLMGMEGAGFLYAREAWARALVPRVAGWLSHERALDFLFDGPGKLVYDKPIRSGIDFLEGGNSSSTAFAALEASLDAILSLGVTEIFDHVQRYNDVLEPKAVELGFRSVRAVDTGGRSGSLSLLPPDGVDVRSVHRELMALGIACAIPDGHLRLSPHWPNALDETEQVLLSLEEATSRARAAG